MINAFQLNDAQVNGSSSSSGATVNEIIAEFISSNSGATSNSFLPLVNSITISTSISYRETLSLIEGLVVNSLLTSQLNTSDFIIDQSNFVDFISVVLSGNIVDLFTLVDSSTSIYQQNEKLLNSLVMSTSIGSRGILLTNLINLIVASSSTSYGELVEILENLDVTTSISLIYKAVLNLSEDIFLQSESSVYLLQIGNTSDFITIADPSNSSGVFSSTIIDEFIIRLPIDESGKYSTYLLAPENKAITSYTNFNFDKSTIFNGKYLFINKTGLFEYGGIEDDLSPIKVWMETSAIDFGTSNLKNIPNIYLACSMDDVLYLKVRVDGKGEMIYKLNKHTENQQNHKINVGKGLTGRYFQFDIITESENFSLENIEFLPMIMRRKL